MQLRLQIESADDVPAASTAAITMAVRCGFGESATERLGAACEGAARALLKQGSGGVLLLRPLQEEVVGAAAPQIELIAIASNPDAAVDAADGDAADTGPMTPRGSGSSGLAALGKYASAIDIYKARGQGDVMRMAVSPHDVPREIALPEMAVGAVCVAGAGDATPTGYWRIGGLRSHWRLVLAVGCSRDGLHGGESARRLAATQGLTAQSLSLERLRASLDPEDSTSLAVLSIDSDAEQMRLAVFGEIQVRMAARVAAGVRDDVLLPTEPDMPTEPTEPDEPPLTTVGRPTMRALKSTQSPWPPRAMVVLHGAHVDTNWHLNAYAGLHGHHPALIAAVLYRDFAKQGKPVTIVVCRRSAECRTVRAAPEPAEAATTIPPKAETAAPTAAAAHGRRGRRAEGTAA